MSFDLNRVGKPRVRFEERKRDGGGLFPILVRLSLILTFEGVRDSNTFLSCSSRTGVSLEDYIGFQDTKVFLWSRQDTKEPILPFYNHVPGSQFLIGRTVGIK